MFNILRCSLSGEKQDSSTEVCQSDSDTKNGKRNQSCEHNAGDTVVMSNQHKKSRLAKSENVEDQAQHGSDSMEINQTQNSEKLSPDPPKLPEGTPEWGKKLLEIMQSEFRSVSEHVKSVETQGDRNANDIKLVERKMDQMVRRNKLLEEENSEGTTVGIGIQTKTV